MDGSYHYRQRHTLLFNCNDIFLSDRVIYVWSKKIVFKSTKQIKNIKPNFSIVTCYYSFSCFYELWLVKRVWYISNFQYQVIANFWLSWVCWKNKYLIVCFVFRNHNKNIRGSVLFTVMITVIESIFQQRLSVFIFYDL
jgi:hypothetical protein